MNKFIFGILLTFITVLASVLRLSGLAWDGYQHLHPDERFISMVTNDMSWPASLSEYLDTGRSKVNPHNIGHAFYVYGTFPLIMTRFLADASALGHFQGYTQAGRAFSALLDIATVVLVGYIAAKTAHRKSAALVAMGVYALIPTAIQQSHFYAVDTFLVFFLTLTLALFVSRRSIPGSIAMGIAIGLAMSSKITALAFFAILALAFLWDIRKRRIWLHLFLFIFCAAVTVRIAYPYAFRTNSLLPNPLLINNLQELKNFDGVDTGFPPALQWIPTLYIGYLPTHAFLWGLGIPLGILSAASVVLAAWVMLQMAFSWAYIRLFGPPKQADASFPLFASPQHDPHRSSLVLLVMWTVPFFIYQSLQFAKALRYVYPVYPALTVLIGLAAARLMARRSLRKWTAAGLTVCMAAGFLWALGFASVYSRPHTRVEATRWIYDTLPPGTRLTFENWDDPLPLPLEGKEITRYTVYPLSVYDPDTDTTKWRRLTRDIAQTDYIILSSNRVWRSLLALPRKFPDSARYYRRLFDGSLGFSLTGVFTSYPCLIPGGSKTMFHSMETDLTPPPIGILQTPYCRLALNDDGAEESFTVYDHPKVMIFKNDARYSEEQLYGLITQI